MVTMRFKFNLHDKLIFINKSTCKVSFFAHLTYLCVRYMVHAQYMQKKARLIRFIIELDFLINSVCELVLSDSSKDGLAYIYM